MSTRPSGENEFVPRKVLIDRAEKWLAGIRERPQMYGAWHGVEISILDALDEREFALAWPYKPPGHIGARWCHAVSKTHRKTCGTLFGALINDGVTDDETIAVKFRAALDEFLSCDGLYPEWLEHKQCGGCNGVIHRQDDLEPPHCSGGCKTYPCAHSDGPIVVARWKEVFARGR